MVIPIAKEWGKAIDEATTVGCDGTEAKGADQPVNWYGIPKSSPRMIFLMGIEFREFVGEAKIWLSPETAQK